MIAPFRINDVKPAAAAREHGEGLLHSAALSQRRYLDEDYQGGEALFPAGRYDEDLQQVDLREVNSWRLRMHEVKTPELLEVQLVNAIAPYVLNARLKPLIDAVQHEVHQRDQYEHEQHQRIHVVVLEVVVRIADCVADPRTRQSL